MPKTNDTAINALLAWYAEDIAFVAEENPATTLADFIDQLSTAAHRLGHYAGINGTEDLETAATYLADAENTSGAEQRVLLNQAEKYLRETNDMVDEYRLMV